MNETPKKIWTTPWNGLRGALLWFIILLVTAFVIVYCINAVSYPNATGGLVSLAFVIAVCLALAGLILIWFIRWLCFWRNLRRFLFAIACLVTFIVLLCSEENWRGHRDWENYRRELEAKGEKFDAPSLAPPPVPDNQNFALTPLFKPSFDFIHTDAGIQWNNSNSLNHLDQMSVILAIPGSTNRTPLTGSLENNRFIDLAAWQDFYHGNTNYPQPATAQSPAADVLTALSRFDPDVAELHQAAATRPFSRFPIEYNQEPAAGILLPHLAKMKAVAILLNLRAISELDLGRSPEALADLKVGFRLSDSVHDEPTLISHLVRIAILSIDLQTVREGLARHAWTDSQLAEIQQYLSSLNLLAEWKLGIRGEQALGVDGLLYLRRVGSINPDDWVGGAAPIRKSISILFSGLYYQNALTIVRWHQKYSFPSVDDKARRVFPEIAESLDQEIESLHRNKWPRPYQIFASLLFPAISNSTVKSARAQSSVDEALLACAVERYQLANHHLPESLDVLAPKFIDKIPTDVMDGQPLRYKVMNTTNYVLYSIGWNKTDDGGLTARKSEGKELNPKAGDWVWFSAAPKQVAAE